MKYLILILTITFNSYASYVPLSKVGKDTEGLKIYTKSKKCEKEYKEKCIKLTKGYNPKTAKLAKKKIPDETKPIKECEGIDAILDFVGYDENGCKITGYEMMDSDEDIIVVDEVKKAQIEAEKAQKEADRAAKKNSSEKCIKDFKKDGIITECMKDLIISTL